MSEKRFKERNCNVLANIALPSIFSLTSSWINTTFLLSKDGPQISGMLVLFKALACLMGYITFSFYRRQKSQLTLQSASAIAWFLSYSSHACSSSSLLSETSCRSGISLSSPLNMSDNRSPSMSSTASETCLC